MPSPYPLTHIWGDADGKLRIQPAKQQIFVECILSTRPCAEHRANNVENRQSTYSQGDRLSQGGSKRQRKAFMGAAEKHRSDTWPKLGRIQLTSKLTPEECAGGTMKPLHPLCEVVWFYKATFWDTQLLGKTKDKAWLGQILGNLFCLTLLDKEEFCTSKVVQKMKVHLSPYQHLNCF